MNRAWGRLMAAPVNPANYRALLGILRVCVDPLNVLLRYVAGIGTYPSWIAVRTPTGVVRPMLYSSHDVRTLIVVFCRVDYPAGSDIVQVVDIGSNIGISALYFLTRNQQARVDLYEPDRRNCERLRHNLAGYEDRYQLYEVAVADRDGTMSFATDATGIYGRLAQWGQLQVPVVHVNRTLERHTSIDILKIDTEGEELPSIRAADPALLQRVTRCYLETGNLAADNLWPQLFTQRTSGGITELVAAARNHI